MSCLNANIAIVEKLIKPSLTLVGGRFKGSLSIVCGVHNSMNALMEKGKILYDDDKLLLV